MQCLLLEWIKQHFLDGSPLRATSAIKIQSVLNDLRTACATITRPRYFLDKIPSCGKTGCLKAPLSLFPRSAREWGQEIAIAIAGRAGPSLGFRSHIEDRPLITDARNALGRPRSTTSAKAILRTVLFRLSFSRALWCLGPRFSGDERSDLL